MIAVYVYEIWVYPLQTTSVSARVRFLAFIEFPLKFASSIGLNIIYSRSSAIQIRNNIKPTMENGKYCVGRVTRIIPLSIIYMVICISGMKSACLMPFKMPITSQLFCSWLCSTLLPPSHTTVIATIVDAVFRHLYFPNINS